MPEMSERTTLYFPAPGKWGRAVVGKATYEGLPVFLCWQRNCQICNLSLRKQLQGWPGGKLEVELALFQRPALFGDGKRFYNCHIISIVEREKIDTGGEVDISPVNTICLLTSSGMIVIDPGEMGPDSAFSLAGLIGSQNIRATWVSHGHRDHWNLAGQVREGPIYVSGLTSRLIDRHLGFEWNPQLAQARRRMKEIRPGQRLTLDSVQIGTFSLPHTIPETMGLDIRGGEKRVVYLGDFRFKGWDYGSMAETLACLKDLASQKVDILALNIINAHLAGITPNEGLILEPLTDILLRAPGRVIIACFSTNLERIARITRVARLLQRPVAFCGAGMEFANELLRGELVEVGQEERAVIYTTGSQSEEWSVLWRIANGENPPMELRPEDTLVFSSRCIPGNEGGLRQLITALRPQVGRVIVNIGEIKQVCLQGLGIEETLTHVSGHGSREDLRLALKILQPKQVLAWPQQSPQIEAFREIAEPLGIEVLPEDKRIIEV